MLPFFVRKNNFAFNFLFRYFHMCASKFHKIQIQSAVNWLTLWEHLHLQPFSLEHPHKDEEVLSSQKKQPTTGRDQFLCGERRGEDELRRTAATWWKQPEEETINGVCNCNVLRGSPVVGLPPDNGADGNQQMTSARAVVTIEGEGRNNNSSGFGHCRRPSIFCCCWGRKRSQQVGWGDFRQFRRKIYPIWKSFRRRSTLLLGNIWKQRKSRHWIRHLILKTVKFTPKCQVLVRAPAHVWTLLGWQLQFLGQFLEHWHFALRLR